MGYQEGHSFAVEAEEGGDRVEFHAQGLTVVNFDLPLDPEPLTETVNVPAKIGGWTYTNNAEPSQLSLSVIVEGEDNADMRTKVQAIADALDPLVYYQIHVDGEAHYWIGKRISGINSGRYRGTMRAVTFEIVFVCDDPTAYDAPQGT